MGKIVFLTNVDRRLAMMKEGIGSLRGKEEDPVSAECMQIEDGEEWSRKWKTVLREADFVLVKWMSAVLDTPFWRNFRKFLEQRNCPYYIEASGTPEKEAGYGVDAAQILKLRQYMLYSGLSNYENLIRYIGNVFCGKASEWGEPDPLCWAGIWHPDDTEAYYTDLAAYEQAHCIPRRRTVGILFYRDEWVWGDLEYQAAMIREIEKQGMNAVCVFTNGMPQEDMGMPPLRKVFRDYFTHDGTVSVDVILNTLKFSFTVSGTLAVEELKAMGIPVIQAYCILAPYEEWKTSMEGLNGMEVSISAALPEFDGVIHGNPVAYKKILPDGDVCHAPIHERIARVVSKAGKWASLKHKANRDKKIAIIFHNYPPKNSNIGSAVGLDTIESVRRILQRMQEAGYRVDTVPEDTEKFIAELTRNATNDRTLMTDRQISEAEKVNGEGYKEFFGTFENPVPEQMESSWGKAPGQVMEYDGSLLVPGTMDGSVFVTVQPPRGFGEDPSKIYHDPFTPPTHQYLAVYHWIRDVWHADAVIHIGTHGTLEWLPGKNAGLDCMDYPDLALGDIPNVYIYHMTITGEGIQAKRRGAACLIEHLPAPMTDAGTYDELAELEKAMDEYSHFKLTEPENADTSKEMIRRLAVKADLDGEVPYDGKGPFDEYVSSLHEYLEELKDCQVHMGLHIFGHPPEGEELTEYILNLLRLPSGDIPSILELWGEKYETSPEEIIRRAGDIYAPLSVTYSELMTRIRKETREVAQTLRDGGFDEAAAKEAMRLPAVEEGTEEWKAKAGNMFSCICRTVYPLLCQTEQEMDNLLSALDGRYVEPGPSGSPSAGGIDLLPTGRNFYGIDPRCLPTPAAWEIGKSLGDQVVSRYIEEERKYPENVGIVMWSGANMRSHGQCIAEFLYLMGVRPVWQPGSLRVNGLEPIPLEELKRPRIDVTARVSGLFRDTMASVMEVMDQAVALVSALEETEEDNYVKKHICADGRDLEEEGLDREEALRRASYRLFGDQWGTYGAGIGHLLEEKNWETIDDLADVYVRWGGHVFGSGASGVYMPEQFRRRLGSLEVTIKNEDNHETNMLSSDDYNAYHGGMIAAVRSIRGEAPRSYCGDSTDRSRPVMHSLQEQTKIVFRSEAVNPKFIKGMMKHGYKGASDLSNYVKHSFQWDATSGVMEDWMYEKYAEKYALDGIVQEWMRRVNPWALQSIAETLMEAERRGLWNAKAETMEHLRELYLAVEGDLEENADR